MSDSKAWRIEMSSIFEILLEETLRYFSSKQQFKLSIFSVCGEQEWKGAKGKIRSTQQSLGVL